MKIKQIKNDQILLFENQTHNKAKNDANDDVEY